MHRKELLFVLILLLNTSFFAQKSAFINYNIQDGLPQSQVIAFTQDHEGYLWIATLGGLAKFNGRKFTPISVDDGLLSNRIKTLTHFDSTLWIGHDGGISCISNRRILHIPFKGKNRSITVSSIIQFQGRILITSKSKYGGGLFELIQHKYLRRIDMNHGEAPPRISTSFVHNSVLYLGTKTGVIETKDLKHFELKQDLPPSDFRSIVGNEDVIYFVTHRTGIFKRTLLNQKMSYLGPEYIKKSIDRSDFSEKNISFRGAYLDSKSNLWLPSIHGAFMINRQRRVRLLDQQKGLPVNNVSCFYEDAEQNIWIGSLGKGMFRYPGEAFQYFDKSTMLGTDLVVTGFQRENGDFLFGTNDAGVLKMTASGEVQTIYKEIVVIWSSLSQVNGKDWFGTQSSLISIDPSQGEKITEYTLENYDLPGSKITALYKLDPHTMYVGGSDGVSLYQNNTFHRLPTENNQSIGTIREFELLQGQLFCVSNLGVFTYQDDTLRPFSNDRGIAYSLQKDHFNQLWFGTEEGLFRHRNGQSDQIVLLGPNEPAANYINFLDHKDGGLYVGTNNGLFFLYNLQEKYPNIERFGMSEGLVDSETNLNSGFFDVNGNFWFGSNSGLIRFIPEFKPEDASIPIVHLKTILLNYESFDYEKYCAFIDEKGLPADLELPSKKNNLTFELDGISLSHPNGLEYQFWLEGLNTKWSPLTGSSLLTFNGLRAGQYRLRIRCSDMNGNLSKEVVFPFVIRQAFYRTSWFLILSTLLSAGIIVLFFRLRLKRINEANENERLQYTTRLLVLEQQSMNASMNRHFVFNSLNSIQYFINTHDRFSANKYLTNFAKLIRKNLDSATSEGNMISLNEEFERLRLYLSLEAMRFSNRFDYNIQIENVDIEMIMVPAMVLQPFVENSIIHGILPDDPMKKGNINITAFKTGNDVVIRLDDNGVGIKQSLNKKEEFDGDHRSKGMEITSKRIELIQKISKNKVSLEGPHEKVDEKGHILGTYVLLTFPQENLDI